MGEFCAGWIPLGGNRLDVSIPLRLLPQLPQIQRLLHPQPALRRRVGQTADAHRHVGRECVLFEQQIRHGETANAQPLSELGLAHVERRQHVLAQNGARVGRPALGVS